jgi:hypothetical protein
MLDDIVNHQLLNEWAGGDRLPNISHPNVGFHVVNLDHSVSED